jgi:hypothetical protein
MESFPREKSLRLTGFNWKEVQGARYKAIAALQLVFNNGFSSPVQLAKDTNLNDMQHIELDQTQPVFSIAGDTSGHNMKQLIFRSNEGHELAKISADEDECEEDYLLEGEEIVGLYGHKGSFKVLNSVGFIVWRPIYQ